MPSCSNFVVITFWEHLGNKRGDLSTSATWVGDQTTIRNFNIEGVPEGDGYVLIQAYNIHDPTHRVLINGQNLGGRDIPKDTSWQTWMDRIEPGKLRQGNNTIQIVRDTSTGDNFIIKSVAIHWTESYRFGPLPRYYPG